MPKSNRDAVQYKPKFPWALSADLWDNDTLVEFFRDCKMKKETVLAIKNSGMTGIKMLDFALSTTKISLHGKREPATPKNKYRKLQMEYHLVLEHAEKFLIDAKTWQTLMIVAVNKAYYEETERIAKELPLKEGLYKTAKMRLRKTRLVDDGSESKETQALLDTIYPLQKRLLAIKIQKLKQVIANDPIGVTWWLNDTGDDAVPQERILAMLLQLEEELHTLVQAGPEAESDAALTLADAATMPCLPVSRQQYEKAEEAQPARAQQLKAEMLKLRDQYMTVLQLQPWLAGVSIPVRKDGEIDTTAQRGKLASTGVHGAMALAATDAKTGERPAELRAIEEQLQERRRELLALRPTKPPPPPKARTESGELLPHTGRPLPAPRTREKEETRLRIAAEDVAREYWALRDKEWWLRDTGKESDGSALLLTELKAAVAEWQFWCVAFEEDAKARADHSYKKKQGDSAAKKEAARLAKLERQGNKDAAQTPMPYDALRARVAARVARRDRERMSPFDPMLVAGVGLYRDGLDGQR
jgi:hypothetical protein